ncbi:MAG: RluA family pseudouridine synthase, partial [Anaerolineae bacterium]|nr:RluA family pseudouridine synthase [Anaerolineae bacterium]
MAEEQVVPLVSFTVEAGGERLDKVTPAHVPDLSRATAQRLIKAGEVTVNGRPSKPSYRVQVGDEVVVRVPIEMPTPVVPENIPLDVIYEDDALLVVNKPAGMVVHPAYGHASGTLVNAVLAHCPQIADVGGPDRAGVVHRLDKDTSGLILIAKDSVTRAALQRQFKRRQVSKTYLALVEGQVQPREGVVEAPVGRDKRQRKKMAVVRSGREARTMYRAIEYFANYTLLEVRPHTGRTHQVRVHLSWLGYPIVGDAVYGRHRQRLLRGRHFLHA